MDGKGETVHLIFVVRFDPFKSSSGTEIFAGNLALELAKQGHEVETVYEGRSSAGYSPSKPENLKGHRLQLVGIPYVRSLDFRRKCSKRCSELIKESRIDAVIAFGAGTFSGYIFDRIKKLNGKTLLIYYAMDSMMMEFERSKKSDEAARLFTRFKRWIWYSALIKSDKASCINSELIFASSKDTANHLIADYRVPLAKINLLYEGIPDDFAVGQDVIDPSIPTFLHITGGPRKGTDFFLKAMRLLEDKYGLSARAIIIRASQSNIKQAETVGVEVDAYRSVNTLELKHQYASCTAFVSPSLSEGFCLPVIEAAMFGKPTIAFGSGSLPELINDGIDGFIVPIGDINRLTERMYQISQDKDLRKRMHCAAKKKGQKLGINECSQKFLNIITETKVRRKMENTHG